MYLAIYIIIMVEIRYNRDIAYGIPFKVTNLKYTKIPLDCTIPSSILTISNTEFEKELQLGNFTYSFWIYINGSNTSSTTNTWNTYRYQDWKNIMYRGANSTSTLSSSVSSEDESNISTTEITTQFPGFWLTPTLNNMIIAFQQTGSNVERIQIDNIEMNKWINVTTVVENKSVSIYINGLLDRINNLNQNSIEMSSYSLYINNRNSSNISQDNTNKNFGFPGYLTNIIYYNYALTGNYIKDAYDYYFKEINDYQINLDNKNNTYSVPSLITNSDNI